MPKETITISIIVYALGELELISHAVRQSVHGLPGVLQTHAHLETV
jgi:hypothetical protein